MSKVNNRMVWTEAEISLLSQHYATSSREELLQLLPQRSLASIYRRASKLGLRRHKDDDWTEMEVDILIKNYSLLRMKELQALLPNRTKGSIYMKAGELLLPAHDNKVIDETLMREYGKCSLNKIAQKLGCYRSSLRYRAQILGLL